MAGEESSLRAPHCCPRGRTWRGYQAVTVPTAVSPCGPPQPSVSPEWGCCKQAWDGSQGGPTSPALGLPGGETPAPGPGLTLQATVGPCLSSVLPPGPRETLLPERGSPSVPHPGPSTTGSPSPLTPVFPQPPPWAAGLSCRIRSGVQAVGVMLGQRGGRGAVMIRGGSCCVPASPALPGSPYVSVRERS